MPFSYTYRFLASLTALVLLASIALPAGLHAKHGMSGMEMCEKTTDPAPAAHDCCMMKGNQDNHASSHRGSDHAETGASDCDLGFACACSVSEARVKTEAIPALSKIQLTLPVSVTGKKDLRASSKPFYSIPDLFRSASSPPLFLLNSSFLN